MKTDDFNFDLPEELIAQYPVEQRGQSRLMVLDRRTGSIVHAMVEDIASFIPSGSLLIFNDSKVRKARVYGICDQTGAREEYKFLAPVAPKALISIATHKIPVQDDSSVVHPGEQIPTASRVWRAVCSKSKRQKPHRSYTFPGALKGTIIEEVHDEKIVEFSTSVDDGYFEKYGHVPLPPYIKREDTSEDEQP
jgi:S-adenosylmethionine:tRNA ribosyltransferase-isomerase